MVTGVYLYDSGGKSNLILFNVQRLHPPSLLLVQDLAQLCGHFGLHREKPVVKTSAPPSLSLSQEAGLTLTELRQSRFSLSTVSDGSRGLSWDQLDGLWLQTVPRTSLKRKVTLELCEEVWDVGPD